jgi:hypothetical protein
MRVLRFSRLIRVLALALLLAACGGNDAQPGDTGGAAAGSQDTTGAADTNFSVEVTGAAQITMPPGNAYFLYFPEEPVAGAGRTIPAYYHLRFERIIGSRLYQVSIDFGADTQPGTYELTGDMFGLIDAPAAEFSELELGDATTEESYFGYFENVQGTLTLDTVGASASGSFEFTADYVDFDDEGGAVRTVSVQSAFTDVPLIDDEE